MVALLRSHDTPDTANASPLECGAALNSEASHVYFGLPGGKESILLTPHEAIDFAADLMQAAIVAIEIAAAQL